MRLVGGAILLLLVLAPPAHADEAADLAVVEARVVAEIRASHGRRLSYPGAEHLYAARVQAVKGKTAEALAELDAWLDLDYRHSNWWVNDVPIPRAVGEIALLLRDDLGAARKRRVVKVMHHAWPPPKGGKGKAANLFYRFDAAVQLAVLLRDAELLHRIFDRAAREIHVTRGEGVQEDMSLHQHGPQFYSGSYGLEFLRGAVRVASLGHATGLALPKDRMDLLMGFVLDGLQWIVYGPMIDPGAQGRNFSRKSAGHGGDTVRTLCKELLALDPPRKDELAHFAEDLRGNRCFWRSDFMVQRAKGWCVSTKMASVRTAGTESGNGEGLQQYHMADGACFVFRRGDEYDGIQPVWDWRRVPGTTCKQGKGPLPLVNWGRGARGTTRFVGGVSDGVRGVACMDFDRGGVRAKKAWFQFPDAVACLGAGITADGREPVVTSVQQCLARGDDESHSKPNRGPTWVRHDGIAYVVLQGRLESGTQVQRGTWRSVNRGYGDEPVSREVFSAWIDHGVAPHGAGYAYLILPDPTAERDVERSVPVRVLANTPKLQAVRHVASGWTGIVFHEAGTFGGVAVDRPCAVLLKDEADAPKRTLCVADPAQANTEVHVTLDGAPAPVIARPADGRSVTLEVPR